MRCTECVYFYRLDMRFSPGRVVCAKSGIIDEDTDARRGCGLGRMKGGGIGVMPKKKENPGTNGWGSPEKAAKARAAKQKRNKE